MWRLRFGVILSSLLLTSEAIAAEAWWVQPCPRNPHRRGLHCTVVLSSLLLTSEANPPSDPVFYDTKIRAYCVVLFYFLNMFSQKRTYRCRRPRGYSSTHHLVWYCRSLYNTSDDSTTPKRRCNMVRAAVCSDSFDFG